MEQVAEMEASTQAAQKKLHHDSILSTVNLVPEHQENKFTAKAMTAVYTTAHFHSKRIISQMLTIQVLFFKINLAHLFFIYKLFLRL